MAYPTIGSFSTRLGFNDFINMLNTQLGTMQRQSGLNFEVRTFEDEEFARVAIYQQGRKDVKPLILDLAPGHRTAFGEGLELRSPSGWPAVFGPEIWYGSQESGPELRTPFQSFQKYVEGAFSPASLAISKDPQSWFNSLVQKGSPAAEVAGGLIRYGPVHGEAAQAEYASRVTVGFGQEVKDQQSAWRGIYNTAVMAGQGDLMQQLIPYAPFADDDLRMRMRRTGVARGEGEPGNMAWEVLGLGEGASDILKRLNVVGGYREQVPLYKPTPSGRGMEEAQPDYITGMGDRAGYKWLNAILPGESQRRAAIVRPGTYFSEASPFPGAMQSYTDPLKGIYSAGYPGNEPFEMNVPNFGRAAAITFDFGIFQEKRIKDKQTGEETLTYVKKQALENSVIRGGESTILGTYTVPGEPGQDPITRPLRYTAEGTRDVFITGKPNLRMPVGFEVTSGAPTMGIQMLERHRYETEQEAYTRAGKAEPTRDPYTGESYAAEDAPVQRRKVAMNVQEYQQTRPGYDRPLSEQIQESFVAGGGGEVSFAGQGGAWIDVPTATLTGFSEKTAQKSGGYMATGVEQLFREGVNIPVGKAHAAISGMTAESKNLTVQYMWDVASLPPAQQAKAFGMLPGATGKEMERWRQRQEITYTEEGGTDPSAIHFEDAAQRYARAEKIDYTPGVTVYEMLERMRRRVAQMPPEESLSQFGRADFGRKDAPFLPVGFVLPEEKRFYTRQAIRGLALPPEGQTPITGLAARQRIREMQQFRPVYKEGEGAFLAPTTEPVEGKGDPVGYMWETKSPGYVGASASPPSPEHLSRQQTLGYEELAAINMVFPEAGKALNIRLRQSPNVAGTGDPETGFLPRHMKAWREIGDVYRYQQDTSLGEPIPPKERTTVTPEMVSDLRAGLFKDPEMSLAAMDKLIGGAGPLYNPETQETLERPSTIADVAAYRYRDPEAGEPLNFMVKKYPEALLDLVGGGTRARGPLAAMNVQRRLVFESRSGEAMKQYGGRLLPGVIGGRYQATTGVGLNTTVVQQDRMDAMIRQIAQARDVAPTEKNMATWRSQVEEHGGIPGMMYRSPTISREFGVLATNMVTPSMVKAKTGVDVAESSFMDPSGLLTPKSSQATGIVAAFGPQVGTFIGDWDLDMAAMLGLVDIDPTTKDLIFKGGGNVGRKLAMSPKQVMEEQDKALDLMMGTEAGVPGGQFNVFAKAFSEMAYGKPAKASTSWVGANEIHQAGVDRMQSRYGMGVAYNQRRLMEASGTALGLPQKDIARGHSAQAKAYQQYLDYQSSEFGNLETILQTSMMTQQQTGTKPVRMMGMSHAGGQFGDLWRSDWSTTTDFSHSFGRTLAEAAGADIESGRMLPAAAGYLFQQKGMKPEDIQRQIEQHEGGPTAALLQLVDDKKNYDIMNTPVGLGAMTQIWGRTAGWIGRGAKQIDVGGGEMVDVLSQISSEPFRLRRGDPEIPVGQIGADPSVMLTETGHQMLTRKGGPLGPTKTAQVAQVLGQTKPGYENLPPQLIEYIVGQMGANLDLSAVQDTRIKQAGRLKLSESLLPVRPTIRGSQLPYFMPEDYPMFGGYGPEQVKTFRSEARQKLVGSEVLSLSPNSLSSLFPVDPNLSGPGRRFEALEEKRLLDKGYTDLKAGISPHQSTEMPLMYMGDMAEKFRFTGTPDIMGISPEGQFEITEAKWSKGGMGKGRDRSIGKLIDPAVHLQASAYASGLQAAANVGRDFFTSTVSPWLGDTAAGKATAGRWYEAIKAKGVRTRVATGYGGGEGEGPMEAVVSPTEGVFDWKRYGVPKPGMTDFPLRTAITGATEFLGDIGQVSQSYVSLQGRAAGAQPQIPLAQLAGAEQVMQRRLDEPQPYATARVNPPTQQQTGQASQQDVFQWLQRNTQLFGGPMPMTGVAGGAGGQQPPGGGMIYMPQMPMGGQGDGEGQVPSFLVEHLFKGQGRHPFETSRLVETGKLMMNQAMAEMQPGGDFSGFYDRTQKFISQQLGIPLEKLTPSTMMTELSQIAGEDPAAMEKFITQERGVIGRASKHYRGILQGAKAAASRQVPVAEDTEMMYAGMLGGGDPTGAMFQIAATLQEKGRALGVLSGKPQTELTEDEVEKYRSIIGDVTKELGSMKDALAENIDTLGDEGKARMRSIKRSYSEAASMERARALEGYQEREGRILSGEETLEGKELAQHYKGWLDTLGQDVSATGQEAGMRGQEGGLTPRAASQALRRMIGGFGLFYMGTLAKLGMGQFQGGYQEAQQYQAGLQGQAVQAYGAGEIDPYVSPEYGRQAANIRSGGTVWAAMQRAGTGLAGSPVSDIGGAALTGIGAMGLGMHVAGSMMAVPQLAGAGMAMGTVGAPLIGAAVGVGALAATQWAYARERDDSIARAASYYSRGEDKSADWRLVGPALDDIYTGFRQGGMNIEDTAAFQARQQSGQVDLLREGKMIPAMGPMGASTPADMMNIAEVYGMSGFEEVSHLDPAIVAKLAFTQARAGDITTKLSRAKEMAQEGASAEEIQAYLESTGGDIDTIADIGTAIQAGRDPFAVGRAAFAVAGGGPISDVEMMRQMPDTLKLVSGGAGEGGVRSYKWERTPSLAGWISDMGEEEYQRLEGGMGLMGRTPGIQRQLQGMAPEQVIHQAMGKWADISGGPGEEPFLRRAGMADQRAQLGLDTRVEMGRYTRGQEWTPERMFAETQQNQMYQRGATLATGMMYGGGAQKDIASIESWAGVSSARMAFAERAMQQDPITLTQMSMSGAIPSLMASIDIRGGEVTGLPWGTTGMQRGNVSAQAMATQVWGADYAQDEGLQAATEGLGETFQGMAVPEYMQGMGGMRALQWEGKMISREARKASTGNQLAMLELQGRYQPLFWDIEDRQRGLQDRQAQWGFQMQEKQMEMSGTQFYENRGLQSQQMQMQREWAREDWSTQDQMRTMQWGWKQEDFEENVRFMSGRQRKVAERGMERETVMFGMQGDQIERGRKRQEETWALEDQRFEMTKKHFEEQRTLQEENMKRQREFYEEGKKLRDEQVELQRAYWKEMHALQLAAAGAQASYAEQMDEVNDKMEALGQSQQDQAGLLRVAQSDSVKMTNTIIDGLNHIIRHAPDALKSILGEQEYIPTFSPKEGGNGGGYEYQQAGGDVFPGHNYVVGERGPEMLRIGTIGSIVNQADLLDSGGYRSKWNDTMSLSPQGGGYGSGPQVINLYVGNELLRRFVLSTVKSDLEVS